MWRIEIETVYIAENLLPKVSPNFLTIAFLLPFKDQTEDKIKFGSWDSHLKSCIFFGVCGIKWYFRVFIKIRLSHRVHLGGRFAQHSVKRKWKRMRFVQIGVEGKGIGQILNNLQTSMTEKNGVFAFPLNLFWVDLSQISQRSFTLIYYCWANI